MGVPARPETLKSGMGVGLLRAASPGGGEGAFSAAQATIHSLEKLIPEMHRARQMSRYHGRVLVIVCSSCV
jgi:hypothetical protein